MNTIRTLVAKLTTMLHLNNCGCLPCAWLAAQRAKEGE